MTDKDDPGDYLFTLVTVDRLARAIMGDRRLTPTPEALEQATRIQNNLGYLYRPAAYFHIDEWEHKSMRQLKPDREMER